MIIITVYDTVAGTWSNPVASQNEASAKRDFAQACCDERSLLGTHPSDFKLFAIGDWCPSLEDGKFPTFNAYKTPKFLMQGVPNAKEA